MSEVGVAEVEVVKNTPKVVRNNAPSCYLLFDDKHEGDILVHEICVPKLGAAKYTNYGCLNWNVGHNGHGCCGILDHSEGRCFFFSMCPPLAGNEPIIATFKGTGTLTEEFGDSGTGLKLMNYQLGWKPDKWYTIVIRVWDVGSGTFFGCWVEEQERRKWIHLITVRFPMPGICFGPSTSSFLEDWHGSGKSLRNVWFKNGFKRLLNKSWSPFSVATFSLNQDDMCQMYRDNYDVGCHDNVFYIQTGCTTKPSLNLKPGSLISRVPSTQPHRSIITFKVTKVTHERVEWETTNNTPPQFGFAMIGPSANQSEARGSVLWAPNTKVTVTLEDIFGRQVSKTLKIS